jgi:tetratricopeptide (TPR) repeat protein
VYQQALDQAPGGWRKYGRTAESLLFALSTTEQYELCTQRALEFLPKLRRTVSGASAATSGLGCAAALDEKHADRAKLIAALEKPSREALDDPHLELSADDRSGLYIVLIDARDALEDEEGSKRLEHEWVAHLEKAASEAKTPDQRAVYDSHRLSAYMQVGTPEKAIPMLEQSQRDFPDDYNPPYRLALAYKAMKEWDKGQEMVDQAMAKLYGPRKILGYRLRSDILAAKGDKEGARKTIADAVEYAKSLPQGQRNDRTIASLEKKLSEMPQ